jgi:F420-dependent oxidoreductase-like protein
MELRIMTEPQFGASYDSLLKVAQQAEETGFGGFFRSDHYLTMAPAAQHSAQPEQMAGLPGPSDAWTTLAGLARETSRIALGTLVSSATFRHPGVLAIQVAQVDEMSGGRVSLGLGAGWFEAEHSAYGIPFPATGERFERLAEQLEIVTGLWSTPVGELYNFAGNRYTLKDSPALPKPVQQPCPIIVGGAGLKRTPALAARFATEFNVPFMSTTEAKIRYEAVAEACKAAGRTEEPVYSVMLPFAVGRTDADVQRRCAAYSQDEQGLRAAGIIGSVPEAVEAIGRYAEIGCSRIYLQLLDLTDLDELDLIGAEVIPQL